MENLFRKLRNYGSINYVRILVVSVLICFSYGCRTTKVPTEKYSQYDYHRSFHYSDDHLNLEFKNPLHAPLRVWIFNSNKDLQTILNEINPIEIEAGKDTSLVFNNVTEFDGQLSFSSRIGSLSREVYPVKLAFPFPENREYRVLQGNNTNFTHNTDWSRHAIDFDLKTNDTITSSSNGYVVGVVDGYKFGGKGEEWKPYANYITIYEPHSGVFIQYVHLVHKGSLVNIGDKVKTGQPIALSGNTGQSTTEHLHFNCLIPDNSEDGLWSVPIEFVGGIYGEDLRAGDIVKR